MAVPTPDPPKKRWLSEKARRRIRRALLGVAIALPIAIGAMWYAANHVPWFGAWLADALRSVIGTEGVAELEEFAYGVEDRWNRFWREGEAPKSYWEAQSAGSAPPPPQLPSTQATAAPSAGPSAEPAASPPLFPPKDPGPMHPRSAAPGDGTWVSVPVPEDRGERPSMFKTLLHPDTARPWAEVFVVALDLSRLRIFAVPGTAEPRGTAPGAKELKRTGLIPAVDLPHLVAGFNGGFKEQHGHYGMKVDGISLIRPRQDGCTIAADKDGAVTIGPWKTVEAAEPTFAFWRQTPACLIADGKYHPGLFDENTNWGAALGGGTIVRRSAIGLDAPSAVLFVAVSNHTGPRAIATAMAHVGAKNAAQLDINYSYPRFVLFPKNALGEAETTSLFEGFKVDKEDYVRAPNVRDFFYVVRRQAP